MVNLTCANCGSNRDVENPPSKFRCKICGAPNSVVSELNDSGEQACGCILPTGFEFSLPAGRIGNKITGYKYTSPDDGTPLTKEEYIVAFNIDPEIALEYMRNGGAAAERDDDVDLSTLKRKNERGVKVLK